MFLYGFKSLAPDKPRPVERRTLVPGSETSRAGLSMLFDMLQYHALNKRLVIVILEGVIQTVFPQHHFDVVFKKLHSKSSRIRNDLKNSQRTSADLRRN